MFDWRKYDFPELNFHDGQQIGVIAQDIEKILPQLVYTAPDGNKSVSYEKLTPALIEAIKEQQHQIESEKQKNQKLEEELQSLKERLSALESIVAENS